jgi:hypothetical protein
MSVLHSNLASGRWFELTLYEQMGNIGSEVGRVIRAQKQNDKVAFDNAVERSLELFDLTISDPRRKNQLKEIARAREVFVDALLEKTTLNSSLADSDKYLMQFAIAAKINS